MKLNVSFRAAPFLIALSVVLFAGLTAHVAQACMKIPPQPFCGKTLVLTKAGPPAVFVPGGGAATFGIPYTVFFNMTNVGSPALCPPPGGPGGTFPATVTMNVVCVGGPGLPAPVTTAVNLSLGFNAGAATVTLPAGPPRVCAIVGDVTMTLLDGMILRARGDSVVCIVEPAPNDPSLPRLDLELLTPEMQHAHPGDQSEFRYRITNNDDQEEVTVTLNAEMENASKVPEMIGPAGPPGTGVFSPADPGPGDNFPIAFAPDLPASECVFLPGNPSDPALKFAEQTIVIPPETSVDVPLYARAWGLCANGSCGEGRVVVEGDFAGGDTAVACSGFTHIVDTSVPPSYDWPGAGRVVSLQPLDPVALAMFGEPLPGVSRQIDQLSFPQPMVIDGEVVNPDKPQLQNFQNMSNELARHTFTYPLPSPAGPGSSGSFGWDTQFFTPVPVDQLQIGQIRFGAPNGFETRAPGAKVEVLYNGFGPPIQTIFDVMYQVSGQLRNTATDQTIPIEIVELNLQSVNPIQMQGMTEFFVATGPNLRGIGGGFDAVDIFIDVNAFSHGISDADLDGSPDNADNCAIVQNGPLVPDPGGNVQLDADGDGIGNLCDADFNNDCIVNAIDLGIFKSFFFSSDAVTDLNGDGVVNASDLGVVKSLFFEPPGPGGIPNICSP